MDPTTCFKDICDCINNGDYTQALILLEELNEWLKNSGYLPDNCVFVATGLNNLENLLNIRETYLYEGNW